MKKEYLYGMRMRGFSIGCQPKAGFVDRRDDPEGKYYDIIVYDRPLTETELDNYELDSLNAEPAQSESLDFGESEFNAIANEAAKFDGLPRNCVGEINGYFISGSKKLDAPDQTNIYFEFCTAEYSGSLEFIVDTFGPEKRYTVWQNESLVEFDEKIKAQIEWLIQNSVTPGWELPVGVKESEPSVSSDSNKEVKTMGNNFQNLMAKKFNELKLKVEKNSTVREGNKSTGYYSGWTISADEREIRISNDHDGLTYIMESDGTCKGIGVNGNPWEPSPYEIETKLVELLPGGYTLVGMNGLFADIESDGLVEQTEKIPYREFDVPNSPGLFESIEATEPPKPEPAGNEPTIRPMVKTLEDLFFKFNDRFFGGELETPVITIAPDTCRAYGWFTTWRAWKETDNEDAEGYYEINVTSDYLNRDPVDVASTLLHEMVHLYNEMHGVKDCSRGGKYHNKKFQAAAEAHGLVCEKNQKYGFSITKPTEETVEFIKSFDLKFNLYRPTTSSKPTPDDEKESKEKTRKKSSTRKYVCPVCGAIIRSTKPVNVICGDCMEPFELVES